MLYRATLLLGAMLFGTFFVCCVLLSPTPSFAFEAPKPQLSLNLQQGPLGVTLSLRGTNMRPGLAGLSYIDANEVPGSFAPSGDSLVHVQEDGTFLTSNIQLPTSGPTGIWKIVVTDSAGAIWTVHYLVLAAPGESVAGSPSLTINPAKGASGDVIAFSGSNWLPEGTAINMTLLVGTSSLPLLDTSPVSDKNGMITGAFHLPAHVSVSQASVNATDVASGALRSQVQMLIISSSPTPTTSPTAVTSPTIVPSPTSQATPTSTPLKTASLGSDSPRGPLTLLGQLEWGVLLLVVGMIPGIAALMMILFMLPSRERKRNVSGSGHS